MLPQNDGFTQSYLPSEPINNASACRSKSQGLNSASFVYLIPFAVNIFPINCQRRAAALHCELWAKPPLYDMSPKWAYLVETLSLGSKGFQKGVMRGAWWRMAVLLPNLAENLHHGRGGRGTYWLPFLTGWIKWPKHSLSFSLYLFKMLSRFANASCADMRDKKSLDKLGTLTPDFPTQKPTELANSRDCPGRENLVLQQNI